jgi:hypothetical protein
MITLLQAFLAQVEILSIGIALLFFRHILTGDKTKISELFPDYFFNKYFLVYLILLWFGFFTWLTWYAQAPRYGIWGQLFTYSPVLDSIVLAIVAVLILTMIYTDRYSSKN